MQHRSTGVRGLVFGGIMAALVVVCALIPILSPFMPVPLVLAYVRYGGRVAVLTSIVSAVFAALIVGPVQAFLYLVPGGVLPGLAFGYGFRHKLRPLITGILAVVIFFLGFASEYVVTRSFVFGGRDPVAAALEKPEIKEQLQRYISAAESLNQVPANATEQQRLAVQQSQKLFDEMKQDPVSTFWAFLPMTLFILGVFSAWLNFMLCRFILPRLGHEVPRPTPFGEFRLPTWSTWAFVLLLFGARFLETGAVHAPWWVQVLWNLLPPMMLIFILSGMAVAYGFLRKKDVPKPAAVALTVAGLLLGTLGTQLFLLLAALDPLFDFRGLGHGILGQPTETP